MRIGFGYDSHRFTEGDHVMIGGVAIPFHQGILAHSDGDVLLHAITDALLGALSLGDIGSHFPDTDAQFENMASDRLVADVLKKVQRRGYQVVNCDSTVISEAPRLRPYITAMQQRIADLLQVSVGAVSVKATTNEKMGFIGRQEGLAAQSVVLLRENTEIN